MSDWDDYAAGWDGNEDVQAYAQRVFDLWEHTVAPLISTLSECRVLDFGGGTGLLAEKLATRCGQIVAIDTSSKMVEVLRRKLASTGTDNVIVADVVIDAESIKDNSKLLNDFGLIVASSVCSFLPDYEATLRDLSSIMKPGACYVQWDWMEDMPKERIREAFRMSGMTVHVIEQAFSMRANGESMPVVMGVGRKPPFEQGATNVKR